MILFIVSFIAGVLTILAPCTLPLLPVIVGSSVVGASGSGASRRSNTLKALTISLSLGASVVLFTLLLKFSTAFINIQPIVWSIVSGTIIILFGLSSLFPNLWEKIPGVAALNVSSNKMLGVGYKRKGIIGDIIIGASLGPVFSTCSPTYFVILATVLPQSFLLGLTYLIAYAVGLGGMIMLVAVLGQKIVSKLGGLSDSHGWFKRSLGALFIVLGILIIFGVDKIAERRLLDSGIFDITKVEQRLLNLQHGTGGLDIAAGLDDQGPSLPNSQVCTATDGSCPNQDDLAKGVAGVLGNPLKMTQLDGSGANASVQAHRKTGLPIAPELVNPDGYINTGGKPIHLADYLGKKVVLLDVWTYSCINCQRTLPYVSAWYDKYKDQGLEVIGLHTPEFAFEKVQSNVEKAVQDLGIKYPVVLDNEYATWNAYGNTYWPRKYLINEYGEIVYDHIGEGNYDETEMQIQKALAELNSSNATTAAAGSGANVSSGSKVTSSTIGAGNMTDPKNKIDFDPSKVQSPEVYLGSSRNMYLANGKPGVSGAQALVSPSGDDLKNIETNELYLNGTWDFQGEFASTKAGADSGDNAAGTAQSKIIFKYNAKNVYMVLSGGAQGNATAQVSVYVDGAKTKTITVKDQKLYTIVEGSDYGMHTVELRLESGQLNAYTFTFG